jgi:hypothetical protein
MSFFFSFLQTIIPLLFKNYNYVLWISIVFICNSLFESTKSHNRIDSNTENIFRIFIIYGKNIRNRILKRTIWFWGWINSSRLLLIYCYWRKHLYFIINIRYFFSVFLAILFWMKILQAIIFLYILKFLFL